MWWIKKGTFIVFDKGYNDYKPYLQWSLDDIYFVTRQKNNSKYKSLEEFELDEKTDNAILKDEIIEISKDKKTIKLRRIAYWYETHDKVYEFITNNYEIAPEKVVEIHKNRWQREKLFKRF